MAAVAWLAELFPDPKQRERVLGYTQAFSSIGGILVTGVYYLAVDSTPTTLPAIHGSARGVALHADVRRDPGDAADPHPAVPAGVAGLAAEEERPARCKRPSIAELFAPAFRRTTIVTTIMFACSYGAAFGAIQQMPRIVPGLAGGARRWRVRAQQVAVAAVQCYQEIGGLARTLPARDPRRSHRRAGAGCCASSRCRA